MSIKRISGKPNVEWMAKLVSTAFTNQGLVYSNGAGFVQPADATSGNHFGIILRAVVSGDGDYATAIVKVPIDVITPGDVCEADVPNGDLATTDVGNYCDLESDGAGIDPDATSKNVVLIVGFVSVSKALIKVNSMAGHKNVETT